VEKGLIEKGELKSIHRLSEASLNRKGRTDSRFAKLIYEVAECLIKDVGLEKAHFKYDPWVKGAFQTDLMYKDYAIQIVSPYNYVHDHTGLVDPTFAGRKAASMEDESGKYY